MIVYTQVYENYAAHAGFTGEYHWKAKGGNEFEIAQFDETSIPQVEALYRKAVEDLCFRDEHFEEYAIGYEILADDALTDYEQSQMQYEGSVQYPRTIKHLSV